MCPKLPACWCKKTHPIADGQKLALEDKAPHDGFMKTKDPYFGSEAIRETRHAYTAFCPFIHYNGIRFMGAVQATCRAAGAASKLGPSVVESVVPTRFVGSRWPVSESFANFSICAGPTGISMAPGSFPATFSGE
jgi:hypothetical protein